MKRLMISCAAFIFLAGAFWFEALFAPDAEPWPKWEKHDPASIARIDHSDWDLILKSYVRPGPDGVNRFAYSRLAAEDATQLHRYVDRLAAISISQFSRREQLAYWINFYNALTIQVVITHYPIDSIREIDLGGGGFGGGPWDKKLVAVEGEDLSLYDIEHRILRPIWQDPRIHYAVNCASIGCPNLRRSAYEGGTVNRVLESAARNYVNNPRGVSIQNGDLVISSLYVWFRPDFGDSDAAILEHLRRYAGPTLKSSLDGQETFSDHRYDWGLNATDLSPAR
ncbi:MAG: DUF547 domain-containing protein [Alphaproteobacteria bacterium]